MPVEIVGKLRDSGVYSYKVFISKATANTIARRRPIRTAMATITTHDPPRLRGYWQSDDLTLGNRLGLYPTRKPAVVRRSRTLAPSRGCWMDCIVMAACRRLRALRRRYRHGSGCSRPQRYVADSASALLGLQPEDWLTSIRSTSRHQRSHPIGAVDLDGAGVRCSPTADKPAATIWTSADALCRWGDDEVSLY